MPRKKGTVGTKTLIVRLTEQLHADLRIGADGLGMDVSNLVRMILVEHVPTYIERGRDARRRAESARAEVGDVGSLPKGKRKPKARPVGSDVAPCRNLDFSENEGIDPSTSVS